MQVLPAKRGMSLIEVLIVAVIIGVVLVPLLLTYGSYRTSQALSNSTEEVANHVRSVHIFAREAREQKDWGIKSIDSSKYTLYSFGSTGSREEQLYNLEAGITFSESFDIRFDIGTGETAANHIIELISSRGNKAQVLVSPTGVVETKTLQ